MKIPNCGECKVKLCRECICIQEQLPAFCPITTKEELVRRGKSMYLSKEKINNLNITRGLVHKL